MRKQYHLRKTKSWFNAWDVHNLVQLSKNIEEISVDIESIKELDENFWYQDNDSIPTCRSIAEHIGLIQNTDLKYPIILSEEWRVMDGMHRVLKAYINWDTKIQAKRFTQTPAPNYTDIKLDELTYD